MMKSNVLKTAGLLVLMGVLTFVSGCGCQQCAGPAQSSRPVVETRSSEAVKVIWADGHKVDGNFVIHGTFRRQFQGNVPMKAHLDVKVISENGDIIHEIRTEDVDLPRYQVGKGIWFERFEVELEDTFPDSATVVVAAHQGDHEA